MSKPRQTSKLWSKPHICPRYIASPHIGPDTWSRGYFTQLGSPHVEVTKQIEPNLLLSSPFCPKCIISNISTACQRLNNFAQQLCQHFNFIKSNQKKRCHMPFRLTVKWCYCYILLSSSLFVIWCPPFASSSLSPVELLQGLLVASLEIR